MNVSDLPRKRLQELRAQTLPHKDILAWIKDVAGCLVIGVGMLKGGTGKTTTTLYLALYCALMLNLRVCVVDTDDNSQTVEAWARIREYRGEKIPFDVVVHEVRSQDMDLETRLKTLRAEYDVVLVDSGGADKEAYWDLCTHAHLLLLPCAPSGFETHRIPPSMRMAQKAGAMNENPGGVYVSVVMVKVDSRTSLAMEQRGVLETSLGAMGVGDSLVPSEFHLSGAVHYPRAWEETPKLTNLEEVGWLMRYLMKEVTS